MNRCNFFGAPASGSAGQVPVAGILRFHTNGDLDSPMDYFRSIAVSCWKIWQQQTCHSWFIDGVWFYILRSLASGRLPVAALNPRFFLVLTVGMARTHKNSMPLLPPSNSQHGTVLTSRKKFSILPQIHKKRTGPEMLFLVQQCRTWRKHWNEISFAYRGYPPCCHWKVNRELYLVLEFFFS